MEMNMVELMMTTVGEMMMMMMVMVVTMKFLAKANMAKVMTS